MPDVLPSLAILLEQVLEDFAREVSPEQIVSERFGSDRLLRDEDQHAFYAFVRSACLRFPDSVEFIAEAASDLADHLVVSLTSDRAARIECALALYAAAAEVYPADEPSAGRAHLGARVAIALTHRLHGDRAENLADAVGAAERAVRLSERVGSAGIAAEAHAALGSVLLELPGREREAQAAFLTAAERYLDVPDRACWAEATLDAIVALTEAERPADSVEWADLLASAAERCSDVMLYASELPSRLLAVVALTAAKVALARGGSGPLEMAVGLLEDALDAPPDDLHLADEAKLHVNLGVAYGIRLGGDPEENLERAIQAFETARTLFHPLLPFDAALTDLNLAAVYGERIRGDATDNANLAMGAARRARTAFLELGDERMVRTVSLTLGALLTRSAPTSASFAEGVALLAGITRRPAPPHDRASALAALARALTAQGRDATALYREAVDLFETLGAGERWGQTLCDLADALPAPSEAARLYAQVLDRLSLTAHASVRLRAARSLLSLGLPDTPLETSRESVRAALYLASLAPDEPYRAHRLAENAWPILADHVRRCSLAGGVDEAHQTVLHAHGLILMAGLGPRTTASDAPSPGAIRHEALRRSLVEGKHIRDELRPARGRISASEPRAPSPLAIQWQTSGDYVAPISILPLNPEAGEAILTTFVGPDGLWIGLQTSDTPLRGRWYGPAAAAALEALAATITAPAARSHWIRHWWAFRLGEAIARFAEAIDLTDLIAFCPPSCHTLVIRPHRAFHVVPFAALPVAAGSMLLDRFPGGITLLPLPLATVTPCPPPLRNPVSVVPDGAPSFAGLGLDLGGVAAEALPLDRLIESAGKASLLHIAAHAAPNPSDPLAALIDFGGTSFPFYELDLSSCALVTLATCDSASVDLQSVGTNVVGLQASCLLAGARQALAALWPVDDAATAVLLGRFYHELNAGSLVPAALASAQAWVRNATPAALRDWILTGSTPRRAQLIAHIDTLEAARPFQRPFYWAPFSLYASRQVAALRKDAD